MKTLYTNRKLLIISAICLLTLVCFSYTRNNQFTNWDDDFYVTNDPYIKAFTPHNLKVIFTQDITKNNYHPLCMLSLAVNYHFSGMDPQAYYLTNVIIHVANVIFLFLLLLALCARLNIDEDGTLFIASFCALWFGIHPMHVESVAWIAERKDVLYTFFYLLGLLSYLKYTAAPSSKWYLATFFLFVAACLSKPMAVVFPLSLFCIDFLLQRQWNKKLFTEKIIFLLFSFICGAMAFYTQNKTGAITSFSALTLSERVMYASYGFVMYISKLFNPSFLSTFYPYPYRLYPSGRLPSIYYTAPFIAVGLPALVLYITYKVNRTYFRVAAFGLGFFIANVIFVLQFISVGAAIMSDRYSYVAYIGLFFLIAYFLYELIKHIPTFKITVISVLLLLSGMLAYMSYQRTFVWHDSETLLSDAIEKYPNQALLSYKWLGNYYLDNNQPDKALENYNVLTKLHAADAKVYNNIGRIYTMKNDYAAANDAFQQSAALQQQKGDGQPVPAMQPIGKGATAAQKLTPDIEAKVAKKGFEFVQAGQFDAAINQYDVLIQLNSTNPYYYFYRGVAQFSTNKMAKAVEDWTMVLKLNTNDVQKSAAYNLSVACDSLGNDSLAVYYVELAKKMGYQTTPDFVAKLKQKKIAQASKR